MKIKIPVTTEVEIDAKHVWVSDNGEFRVWIVADYDPCDPSYSPFNGEPLGRVVGEGLMIMPKRLF